MIDPKLKRLHGGGRPRVLDLFSGCGGMTLGMVRAGCQSLGGVEADKNAAASYALNFHKADPLYEIHAQARDVTTADPEAVVRGFGHASPGDVVDVIVGGPPCPSFTRVGRAKLRKVASDPQAFLNDPRSQLFTFYLNYVRTLRPLAVVMENVPDFLNWGGRNVAEDIAILLEKEGYSVKYTLLNASSYGVPQMRERFVLVGIHERVEGEYQFPLGTHKVIFPPGYAGSRDVALKAVRNPGLFGRTHHVPTPGLVERPLAPVTVREAIEDLPAIGAHLDGTLLRGARRFDKKVSLGVVRQQSALTLDVSR